MLKFRKLREENTGTEKLIRFTNEQGGYFLPRHKFGVEFRQNKWRRKTCELLEMQIQKLWQEKCIAYNLYNGKKFRFGGIDISDSSDVRIYLGLTCYKDIIGTSQAADASDWQEKGKLEMGNSQAYMSDGLGVGILAFTKDNHLLLIRRAKWTGEYSNMIDRPGGHPEPDNVFVSDGSPKTENIDDAVANEARHFSE